MRLCVYVWGGKLEGQEVIIANNRLALLSLTLDAITIEREVE